MIATNITMEMLTGQTSTHLDSFGPHRLLPEVKSAFLAMQQAAKQAGFNLQPASTFRDFTRQQTIWNEKFNGLRPVLDKNSHPVDIHSLTVEARCKTILYWSALPGASRHHWGTDLDIYDPSRLPEGKKLLLEPWEYENGGYFASLSAWLTENMANYHFYRPFSDKQAAIAPELWHISYQPLAQQFECMLTPKRLLQVWQGKEIAGYEWLSRHLDEIFNDYIYHYQRA